MNCVWNVPVEQHIGEFTERMAYSHFTTENEISCASDTAAVKVWLDLNTNSSWSGIRQAWWFGIKLLVKEGGPNVSD